MDGRVACDCSQAVPLRRTVNPPASANTPHAAGEARPTCSLQGMLLSRRKTHMDGTTLCRRLQSREGSTGVDAAHRGHAKQLCVTLAMQLDTHADDRLRARVPEAVAYLHNRRRPERRPGLNNGHERRAKIESVRSCSQHTEGHGEHDGIKQGRTQSDEMCRAAAEHRIPH